ncbi:MAG: AhpC/TSA family [Acidobacteriota bacterium]|nr:AhpC/TSA family [Acidobacteriota bacterium]
MNLLPTCSTRRSVFSVFSAFLLLAALLLTAAPAAAQGIRLRGLKGEQLAESELSQGTSILVFWTSWSPHSRDVVERVNPLAQRWGGKARVATVNFQEDAAAIQGFLAGKSLAAPVFLDSDGAFSKKYAIAALPGLLIVKDGQVVYRGKLPDDPDRVIAGFF